MLNDSIIVLLLERLIVEDYLKVYCLSCSLGVEICYYISFFGLYCYKQQVELLNY